MFKSLVSLALLGALLLVSAPTATPGYARTNRAYTLQRAREFVNAYNRHDIAGVLATLDTSSPQFNYGDCDYALRMSMVSRSKAEVAAWLRVRFVEGDYFTHVTVFNHNPHDNSVAGVQGSRQSDVLRARGIPPLLDGYKMVIDASGRFYRVGGGNWGCYSPGSPSRPSAIETRVLTTAFVDAYNAHLTDRVLQILTPSVVYSDCDYQTHRAVTLKGQAQVRAWLSARFGTDDQLRIVGRVHGTVRTATLALTRSNSSLGRAQSQTITVRVEQYGSALQHVALSGAGCR